MKCKDYLFFCLIMLYATTFLAQENNLFLVEIKGAKKTNSSFLKKLLFTKKGTILDSLTLQKDILQLIRLPAISNANYEVFNVKENLYNVIITVEENYTLIPNVTIWTTTNSQFSYKLGLYDYNFLGRNIAFGGFYQNNGFDSYGINFRAENLFSNKWGLAVSHQNWKSEEPLYFENKTANYIYNNVSFEVLGLYQINLKNKINFGLNLFNEKYQYVSGITDPSIPQKLDLNKKLLKFVYSYDNLESNYQYLNGFKSLLNIQFVTSSTSFQKDFLIAWNDFFYFKRVGEKGVWANRMRFGLSSNENTPFAPFALDNNVNLRGVGILVDRGTGVFVWNTEYRHTVYDKNWLAIQTNFFTDMGSWRNPGGEINDFFKRKNVRLYTGVGLRFISKKIYNAIFRIDYGFRVTNNTGQSKGGLVFGIGQYF
ncbi:MAG: outer membrane protein assembly factor [Polaribacter sp.]